MIVGRPSKSVVPVKHEVVEYKVGDKILTVEKNFGWVGPKEGLYREWYPELIYAWTEEGLIIGEMNLRLYVTRGTFCDWQHRYPLFGQAVEYAKLAVITAKEKLAWQYLIEQDKMPKINVNLFKFMMAGLDRENYGSQHHTTTQIVEEVMEAQKVVEVSSNIRETFSKIEDRLRAIGPNKTAPVIDITPATPIDKSMANQKIAKVASEKAQKKRSS